ncbi:epithelial-stromal interaction protein 1 [Enoplosus armatus]|uniref:epithelial-stromal interaction protein 1 n=1 Tax=Enoplosus armatus TaxID=215367 RepID=UPI0039913651
MDPHQNHLNPGRNISGASGNEQTPGNPASDAPDSRSPHATDRRPQHSGGFTVIPPNESRRNMMRMTAQKEEEALQQWKEANRAPAVHLNPERLGGNGTLAEAREKQFTDLRCSKLQKQLRKEELDKRRRQEEEEELRKKKAVQREKAELQEERRRQEDRRRSQQLKQDHTRTTETFLQRFERTAPGPPASSSATHTSSRSEAGEVKQKSVRDVQLEHRRVNSAFLDRLEGRESEKEAKGGGVREAERPSLVSEDFRRQPSNTPGQQLPLAHLNPDPEQSCCDWTEEADPEPDYDWALMKLITVFPDCSRVFLEDILDQCDGDYERAYTLLMCTLS